jgi:hypothetical protein
MAEPSKETLEEVGRLCQAWSWFEAVTDTTLLAVSDVSERENFSQLWRIDIWRRWEHLLQRAERGSTAADLAVLRKISTQLVTVIKDRNIIIHGLVHASAKMSGNKSYTDGNIPAGEELSFIRAPCWSISRGPEAGKNFPVSTKAAECVRLNIQKLGSRLKKYNNEHGYKTQRSPNKNIEGSWPIPLPD